jgi:hypothetical protein
VGEGTDRLVGVVHSLKDAGTLELVDNHLFMLVGSVEYELSRSCFLHAYLDILIDVAIGVTRYGYRLLPAAHSGLDARDGNGSAEHRSVKNGTDGAVRAFPHLMEAVFRHARGVRGDGGALHSHTIFLCGFGRLDCYAILGLVALGQTQVEVNRLQVYERKNELVLDHLPQDTGHFVTVHLHNGSCHFDFFHGVWFYLLFWLA